MPNAKSDWQKRTERIRKRQEGKFKQTNKNTRKNFFFATEYTHSHIRAHTTSIKMGKKATKKMYFAGSG